MSSGLLLILSAPSGTGKTTLAHRLLDELGDRGMFSVSYTTRAPRGREQDGVDYCFVDEARFQQMSADGCFLEWAQVHGQLYGSHQSTLDEAARGKVVLFDIDVQGGLAIKARHPEAVAVLVLPPSMEELERRLRERGTEAEGSIARRLSAARQEIALGGATYDYQVVNGKLEEALEDLRSIVRAEGCRRERRANSFSWGQPSSEAPTSGS